MERGGGMNAWERKPTMNGQHLLCFGFGYTARAWAAQWLAAGGRVSATSRRDDGRAALAAAGVNPLPFADSCIPGDVTHVLSSVPPTGGDDPVLAVWGQALAAQRGLAWVGYLSATSVYGDRGGALVDEMTPVAPVSRRGRARAAAETAWRAVPQPVHVFRLAGIYGPGRSVFDRIEAGTAQRIDKPGHKFSRIHVADAAAVLAVSAAAPESGLVLNVCDDEPAAAADLVAYACALLDREPPPLVPFAQAAADMTPMAREFWSDNRRVSNTRMHRLLGTPLRYPGFRQGLAAILRARRGAAR